MTSPSKDLPGTGGPSMLKLKNAGNQVNTQSLNLRWRLSSRQDRTERESRASRTFDDPRQPTSSIVLIFQRILGRSGPERHRLHRECGRTQIPAQSH